MRQLKITQQATSRDERSMQDYLSDINKIDMIDIDQEVELARRIKAGGPDAEQAKQDLVKANLRFVVSVAKQYQGQDVPLGDLINEGNIGLIRAAERFDDERGFKFISYSIWWIRQSILQALSDYGRPIRLPMNNVGLLAKYNQMAKEFQQEFQRDPTIDEFAQAVGITTEKAARLIATASKVSSIDAPKADDNEQTISDGLSSESVTDSALDKESLHYDLLTVLKEVLKQREVQILCEAFGINGPMRTIEEISDTLGMSRERVRQIREQSIVKLQKCNCANILRQYL